MPTGSARLHTELARAAGEGGPAAPAAQSALGDGPVASRLQAAILALAQHRAPAGTICPSDAARAVGGDDWRELTTQSREIAIRLARAGDVHILQGGVVRDPDRSIRGPIRIGATTTES
ncbi:MAG TPA: DUF3253 domain-containing protein [Mycobacterium sp.]|jgi:hypothetical protein|nr:DUF3253 domain-containing protein [Mycobacterium sp.]